jgi:hypothetical protein
MLIFPNPRIVRNSLILELGVVDFTPEIDSAPIIPIKAIPIRSKIARNDCIVEIKSNFLLRALGISEKALFKASIEGDILINTTINIGLVKHF